MAIITRSQGVMTTKDIRNKPFRCHFCGERKAQPFRQIEGNKLQCYDCMPPKEKAVYGAP